MMGGDSNLRSTQRQYRRPRTDACQLAIIGLRRDVERKERILKATQEQRNTAKDLLLNLVLASDSDSDDVFDTALYQAKSFLGV